MNRLVRRGENWSSTPGAGGGYATLSSTSVPYKGRETEYDVKGKPDVHNYQKRLQDALNGLEFSQLADEDKDLIRRFIDVLRAQGISLGRVAKYVYQLKTISRRNMLY